MKDLRDEAQEVRKDINRELDKASTGSHNSGMTGSNSGITGAVTTVTGTVGAAVGGASRTFGGIVGAAGRGLGGTINNTTGTRQVGDGLVSLTNGVENATVNVAKGFEDGSRGKTVW